MCLHTKAKRIRRHDDIKDLVADKLPKEFSTFVEPVVNVAGDLKKTDLVIKHREGLMTSRCATRIGPTWPTPTVKDSPYV